MHPHRQTRAFQTAPAPQVWPLAGAVAAGLVLMLAARFALHSPFFQIQSESRTKGAGRQ
jgi:hypothetical protein